MRISLLFFGMNNACAVMFTSIFRIPPKMFGFISTTRRAFIVAVLYVYRLSSYLNIFLRKYQRLQQFFGNGMRRSQFGVSQSCILFIHSYDNRLWTHTSRYWRYCATCKPSALLLLWLQSQQRFHHSK